MSCCLFVHRLLDLLEQLSVSKMTENWRDWRTTRGTHPSCHSLALSDAHTHTHKPPRVKNLYTNFRSHGRTDYSVIQLFGFCLLTQPPSVATSFVGTKNLLNVHWIPAYGWNINMKYWNISPQIPPFTFSASSAGPCFSRCWLLPPHSRPWGCNTPCSVSVKPSLDSPAFVFLCVALNLHKFGGAQL